MGKRKERRLAASNRRVKLDLLAEPSGDFGDSTNQEEVGGGGNAQNDAESPNSPSSSDQRPENPLLLLGQYSDEEMEKESGKEINQDTRENSPAKLDEQQVKVDNLDGLGKEVDESLIAEKIDQEKKNDCSSLDVPKLEENGVLEDNKTEYPLRDADAVDQASAPWTSDMQTTGDVDSGWKVVLHEESNSYYYWNIVTGETSWEVPAVLTQGNESTYDPKAVPEAEEIHVTSADTQPNRSTNGMVFEATEIDGSSPELEGHNEKYPIIMEIDKNEGGRSNPIGGVNYLSSHGGFAGHYYGALSNGEAHHTDSSTQDMSDHVYQPTVGDTSSDSFRLLQLGESLSERLKSLKGSEGINDQITRLMFELNMRLADINSLVPYGSSLLPFWLHSENQLKKLETAVNNEVLKHSQFANICETNEAESKSQENICEITANERNPTSTSLEFDASDHAAISKETVEANQNAISADIVSNVGPYSVEDVDMDVEMEVEDALGVYNGSQTDHSAPPIPHGQPDSHEFEEKIDIPPPPNDEWIPPPPPDDEPLPPPPPDETPEVAIPLPPSELQTAQPYSYGEQYSYTYPGPSFEYYGQTNSLTTEDPSNGYYVDATGCQVAAPLPTLYYAAVPSLYPDSTLVMNPSEPATYYTLQEGIDQAEPSTEVPSILASTVKRNASLVSAPTVATAVAPEPVPKVQPKVPCNKKRTVTSVPSLRSNKKVSGLVDKWKAVRIWRSVDL